MDTNSLEGDLKYLLPLASVSQMKKVSGNVLIIKQNEEAQYIYFIKSGVFKVMRELDFIKKVPQFRANRVENYYANPEQEDYPNNVKKKLLEIDRLKKYTYSSSPFLKLNSFGDRFLPETENRPYYEPFSVVSVLPSEIYFIERNAFIQLVPNGSKIQFKTFPNDQIIRKKFYEQTCWQKFKTLIHKNHEMSKPQRNTHKSLKFQSPKAKKIKLVDLVKGDFKTTRNRTTLPEIKQFKRMEEIETTCQMMSQLKLRFSKR